MWNFLRMIQPEEFSLAFFHLDKTLIVIGFLIIPEIRLSVEIISHKTKHLEKSPCIIPSEHTQKKIFAKKNAIQLKRIPYSNSVKSPRVTYPVEYSSTEVSLP